MRRAAAELRSPTRETTLEIGEHPTVLLRIGTSDYDVFVQVFAQSEYGALPDSVVPGLIVDCGANVGYAAVYLLDKYRNAELIAIEPDPANAELARRNLAAYASRATVVQGAVWSHAAPLRMLRGQFRDGREWAFQVEEVPAGTTPEMRGIDLGELIGSRTVELLKIDIERAELELFTRPCPWLASVRNIAIELHDEACSEAFHCALAPYEYDESSEGDLTYCCNLRLRDPAQAD